LVREKVEPMSSGGDDNNSNKTVFRPSPLQGLKGKAPEPGSSSTAFTPPPGQQPAPEAPAAPAARLPDDDIPRPSTPPRSRNPMMSGAAQVLALAASVRAGRAQIALPALHGEAAAAIATFDQQLVQAGYPDEQRQRAKYAVCATIDDIAQNLPGQTQDGAEWARRSLVVHFFAENIGGDRFWQLVEDMLARPATYPDVIELYHACLAAGFEGRFRIMPDGKSRLHDIMTQLYAALAHVRTLNQQELSPHWKGEPTPQAKVGFWSLLALVGGVALAFLLVVYIILRLILAQTGQPAMAALKAINPDQPLRLSRVAAPPPTPPPSSQLQTLQRFLAPEIAQHLVVVEQDPSSVRVRTTVGQLFKSGSEQLDSGRDQLFRRIGQAIGTQPADMHVDVNGYTDSDRVSNLTYPDNIALSKARADAIAAIVKSTIQNPGRVASEGFGDRDPVASNSTAAGKSLNRRVEIVIPRTQ
jgi:type VI secretion system protein ImpK